MAERSLQPSSLHLEQTLLQVLEPQCLVQDRVQPGGDGCDERGCGGGDVSGPRPL